MPLLFGGMTATLVPSSKCGALRRSNQAVPGCRQAGRAANDREGVNAFDGRSHARSPLSFFAIIVVVDLARGARGAEWCGDFRIGVRREYTSDSDRAHRIQIDYRSTTDRAHVVRLRRHAVTLSIARAERSKLTR